MKAINDQKKPRSPGFWKDQVTMSEDFEEPLPLNILEAFLGVRESAPPPMTRTVLVCQNTTCSQQGSAKVLTALQSQAPASVTVKRSGCLGECGSGPMVLVMPEETWYCCVRPQDVSRIVSQHLEDGKVVSHKLYSKFHPTGSSLKGWLIVFGILLGILLSMFGLLASQSAYF
jgi:(2Fe-2S) ferredoxin